MLLSNGAKFLVTHRRLFAEDNPRFFVGTVDMYADGIAKLSGFTWTRDSTTDLDKEWPDLRPTTFVREPSLQHPGRCPHQRCGSRVARGRGTLAANDALEARRENRSRTESAY
jgi:hypothetical protein